MKLRPDNKPAVRPAPLEWIRPSPDGSHFVRGKAGTRFVAWGVNYDHDAAGRLLEDYWMGEWETVVSDFREMKSLGANVARIHLQIGRFMDSHAKPNAASLKQLARLVKLAEDPGRYLDLTGLACYHKKDVPAWYDALPEAGRWEAQAVFWSAVARVCADSPAVFCYDLMNEPIVPGPGEKQTQWLTGELDGKFFVQRIALDLGQRTAEQVARAWVEKLVAAIRKYDRRQMITVGVIPLAIVFPGANPLFYSREVSKSLDFVSIHVYPKRGEVAQTLARMKAYDIGKPLVIEETFPLECDLDELNTFVEGSRTLGADGWLGFYWGKTIDDYARGKQDIPSAITRGWLEYFRKKATEIQKGEKANISKSTGSKGGVVDQERRSGNRL